MSHPNSPEYFTISTVNQYDGDTTVLAICEDMDAVMYRIKQCYSSCGDEYRINCYHLTTASDAAERYNEQMVNRRKYQQEEAIKEDKAKRFDEMLKSDEESEKEKLEFEEMMNYDALSDDEKYLQSQKMKDESNT
jgi:hypothetical protein